MKTFHVNPSVSFKVMDDEQVLVHLDTGFFFTLQGIGVRVWELLENGADADSLIRDLLFEYEVEEGRLVRDIDALLHQLQRHDLIVEEH